ncbi:MAG: UDP-N-acetyl-D-glucosamine dehydrogenase, partial [Gemmatimonadales bacterium]|nr:UDP-N-acetyl-D-glucosamine dehydrogenase [Gemmatimonadales bacterium]
MSLANDLIARAASRDLTFGIVGCGYVGLPLAVELGRAGFKVIGYDISERV